MTKLEEFNEEGSGWSLGEIINLAVNINSYEPLKEGLSTFESLPDSIKAKKAVVNISNNDVYCFLRSVTAALHPTNVNANQPSSYPHFRDILKYHGLKFLIELKDFPKFKDMNE
uniref:Uncharacterized protein n=1 Tax=Bracon brevicornis TaxID=1563983 RepID=A0A6V7JU78_9HYME